MRTLIKMVNKVSFIYGKTGGFSIYVHRALALTPAQTTAWRQELNKSGVLIKSGKDHLIGLIRPENQDALREIVLYLFKQVRVIDAIPP